MIWIDLGTRKIYSNIAGCRVNRDMVLGGCSDFTHSCACGPYPGSCLWSSLGFCSSRCASFLCTFFGSGPSADPSHVISSSLGLLVSMDALRLGFFVSDHFWKWRSPRSCSYGFSPFFKFNTLDTEMEVKPAIKVIEVFLYLLALFLGNAWGTSLILSLVAPLAPPESPFWNNFLDVHKLGWNHWFEAFRIPLLFVLNYLFFSVFIYFGFGIQDALRSCPFHDGRDFSG